MNSSANQLQLTSVATIQAALSIAWSQLTGIPAGFIKDGTTIGSFIRDSDIQTNQINPNKLNCISNNTIIAQTAGTGSGYSAISLNRTNCNSLFSSSSIEISKIYNSDAPSSYAILARDAAILEWGDDSNLTKTFWDNILATGVVDTTKIENAGTNYSFMVRTTSTPTWVTIDT